MSAPAPARSQVTEILTIGDELVRGLISDANGAWLAKRLTAAGLRVERIVTIPDEPAVVAREIRAALAREPGVVVTTGGLGPTSDDRTLQAVADATGRRLAIDEAALARIARRYDELARAGAVRHGRLTAEREKMARLPEGARPLENNVGTAPGVALDVDGVLILSLPGVPAELQAMWQGPISPLLVERFGRAGYGETTLVATCDDESALASLLRAVADRNPEVYVKSRASAFRPGAGMRITLVAGGADDRAAEMALARAVDDLRGALERDGYALAPG